MFMFKQLTRRAVRNSETPALMPVRCVLITL
jgi:hypothetical protein